MNKKITEKIFYNAVAVVLEGSPHGMRLLKRQLELLNTNVFPGWEAAFEYLKSGAADGGLGPNTKSRPPKSYSKHMPDPWLEVENLEQRKIEILFLDEPGYPQLLREIHNPPLALYIRGYTTLLIAPTASHLLTIVGTRNATPDGKAIARQFSREISRAGFTIVSGLAFGIDAEAHGGALEAGKTIAVLARGVDKIYPREHQRLADRILENGGAIISEYPPGEPPYPDRFLERNRIVSGLSSGVLVIEAPERSGSLATANFALEQNRHVFVVPGPITHKNFFGSHALIRQGADLVSKPEDIFEAFGMDKEEITRRAADDASDEEKQVLLTLQASSMPLDVDKIIEMTKLEPRVVNRTVSFLVLRHLIKETESGYIIE